MQIRNRTSLTKEERSELKKRFGSALMKHRLEREANREKKMGGLITWCPMLVIRPFAMLAFHLTGLYRIAHRQYLNFQLREECFYIPDLSAEFEDFTILHLSDLHIDLNKDFPPAFQAALRKLRGRYDLACVTGDFNNFTVHANTLAVQLLAKLMPDFTAPIYGVLGNHDSLRDVPLLEQLGIKILLNEGVSIHHGDASIFLAGVDDPNIFRTHDLKAALKNRHSPQQPTVLLAHAPSLFAEAAREKVSLVLAGHVHGGQICLPNGAFLPWRNWRFPKRVRRGRWCFKTTQGYTSFGTGACGIPLRLNCPPELVLIKLKCAKTKAGQ